MPLFHSLGFAGAGYVVLRLFLERLAEIHRRDRKRGRGGRPKRTSLGIPIVNHGTRVVLYGLSANPPTGHGGHGSIVNHLCELFDEVWILPVFRHVYKAKQNMVSYEHRRRMCELAFCRDDHDSGSFRDRKKYRKNKKIRNQSRGALVRVLDIEKNVVLQAQAVALKNGLPDDSVTVGSFDILTKIQAANREAHFAWCLGGDAYRDLRCGKWRSHEQFQRNCAQVVVPRLGGLDALHEVGLNANTRVLEIEEVDESISSTTIREMLFERGIFWKEAGVRLAKMYSQGDETQKPKNTKPKWDGGDFDADVLTDAMHPDVLRYIEKHSLYG